MRGPRPGSVGAVAFESRDRVAALGQQRGDLLDDALFAAGGTVAVVDQKYPLERRSVC
jgi:hypothetical protein